MQTIVILRGKQLSMPWKQRNKIINPQFKRAITSHQRRIFLENWLPRFTKYWVFSKNRQKLLLFLTMWQVAKAKKRDKESANIYQENWVVYHSTYMLCMMNGISLVTKRFKWYTKHSAWVKQNFRINLQQWVNQAVFCHFLWQEPELSQD